MTDIEKNIARISDTFSSYSVSLDRDDIIKISSLSVYDIQKEFNNDLRYINCTRLTEDNKAYIQTIDYTYHYFISRLWYMLEKLDFDGEYVDKLIDIHTKNLEFEKINPPIIYKKKTKSKRKTVKEEKVSKPKVSKPKIDKLKKLSLLTFKLK